MVCVGVGDEGVVVQMDGYCFVVFDCGCGFGYLGDVLCEEVVLVYEFVCGVFGGECVVDFVVEYCDLIGGGVDL